MKKKIKPYLITVCIIILLIIFLYLVLQYKKYKAKDMAIKYLDMKYTQQMNFIGIKLGIVEPAMYYVSFSPQNNPDIIFTVLVETDLTFDDKNSPDNYLLRYFEFHLSNEIQSIAKYIWDNPVMCGVSVEDNFMVSRKVPKEINEYMTYEQMEPYLDYAIYIWITTDKKWGNINKHMEAEKILKIMNNLQFNNHFPKYIVFSYKSSIDKDDKKIVDFYDWKEISDVSQIEEFLNKY